MSSFIVLINIYIAFSLKNQLIYYLMIFIFD